MNLGILSHERHVVPKVLGILQHSQYTQISVLGKKNGPPLTFNLIKSHVRVKNT